MTIRTGQKGFTLIEVIAAVSIIAIAFLSILKINSQSLMANAATRFYAKAPLLAQKLISEWETHMAATGSAPEFENTMDGFEGFEFNIDHGDLESALLFSDKAEDAPVKLVEIICRISYGHGQYNYTSRRIRFISPRDR